MDDQRFDAWVRGVWARSSRRAALRAAAGGLVAGGLALLAARGAAGETKGGSDATCRCAFAGKKFCQSERCDRDDQCCSGKCINFDGLNEPQELGGEECRGKRCLCRFEGARCGKDCACCSGNCKNGRCARRP